MKSLFFIIILSIYLYSIEHKKILFISSYHSSFPTIDKQIAGLKEILTENKYQLDIEFMDTKRFDPKKIEPLFYQRIKQKGKLLEDYQLILVGDDNALHFVEKYQKELFDKKPIVFFAVNNIIYAKKISKNPSITGVLERASIYETIELIQDFHSNTQEILTIVDNTVTTQGIIKSFESKILKQLNFFNISDYTFQEATKILDSFPSNKPLLFLSSFVDKKGETKDFYSSIRYIQEHTTSPIYHFYEHGIGYGLLGGKVVIFKEQGRLAAKIAVEVLEGKDISQIKPKVTLNQYVFDYNELKKHRLSHKIPENSIVINKPKSFLDQPILNILIEIIIGLCVLVMFMIYLFYSLRQKSKQLLSTMKEQSSLLTLFDRGDNVLFKWKNDTTWSISYVSSNVSNLLGYSKDEFLNKKIVYAECIHNDDIKKVSKEVDNAKKFHKTFFKHTPYRLITKNGEVKWILDYTVPIYNEKEKIDYFLGIVVDITKEKRIQNTLEKLIDSQSSMIVLSNGKRYSFANKKFYDFFGCESLEKFYKKHISISSLFVENDRFFHLGKVTGNKVWMETIQLLPENERVVAIPNSKMEICAFSVNTTKFDENTYLISFTDISQTMINQIKLEEKTIHDKLTGVYNREFFDAKYNSIFEEFQRNEKLVGLAIFDIDFFKKVNDTFGHDVGDKILIKFVKKIIETSRDEDYLIRWGGEEFLLLLKVTSKNALIFALEKIRESIEKADFDEVKHLTCSIGASIYKKNEKVEQVIKRADKALYNAKENGRNRIVVNLSKNNNLD